MSSTIRNITLATALAAAAGASVAARQAGPETILRNPLSVSMLADAASSKAFMGTVDFRISNNSAAVLKVPYWQLPGGSAEGRLFEVFHAGKRVEYLGPMIKRAAPTEADMVVFQPYETKVFTVDLSESYDLGKTGEYTVTYGAMLQGARAGDGRKLAAANGQMASLRSATLKLWVDGDSPLKALKGDARANKGKPGSGGTTQDGISFVGCSATQMNTAVSAVVEARKYSEGAKGYLAGNLGERYTWWFGSFTTTRANRVTSNFGKIDTAMDQSGNQIKINCGCNQSYYAYVYPNRHYEIFVCRAFWSAPLTGTDSKAGTLIHEMSHFDIVAGTDDHVYGQTGAHSLAISNPDNAVDNADNHEYFAENTPNRN
jgi:peptidyl-Lys metalloendopeptidase